MVKKLFFITLMTFSVMSVSRAGQDANCKKAFDNVRVLFRPMMTSFGDARAAQAELEITEAKLGSDSAEAKALSKQLDTAIENDSEERRRFGLAMAQLELGCDMKWNGKIDEKNLEIKK